MPRPFCAKINATINPRVTCNGGIARAAPLVLLVIDAHPTHAPPLFAPEEQHVYSSGSPHHFSLLGSDMLLPGPDIALLSERFIGTTTRGL